MKYSLRILSVQQFSKVDPVDSETVIFTRKRTTYTSYTDMVLFNKIKQNSALPVGESNPGLPRDRRGYLPLY